MALNGFIRCWGSKGGCSMYTLSNSSAQALPHGELSLLEALKRASLCPWHICYCPLGQRKSRGPVQTPGGKSLHLCTGKSCSCTGEGMDTDGVGVSSHFCRTPLDQVSRQRDESPVLMGSCSGGGQRCVNWRQSDIMGIRLLSTGLSQHKSSALSKTLLEV